MLQYKNMGALKGGFGLLASFSSASKYFLPTPISLIIVRNLIKGTDKIIGNKSCFVKYRLTINPMMLGNVKAHFVNVNYVD